MTKNIREIRQDFEAVLNEVSEVQGLKGNARINVAISLLEEFGRFQRGEIANAERKFNGNAPATENQKFALRKYGINFSENITKADASEILSKVMAQKSKVENKSDALEITLSKIGE